MDIRQPPVSAFARFSDMIKETTRRKRALTLPPSLGSSSSRENGATSSRRPSRDERRSSTAQFTDKMRHMLTVSHERSTGINDLPVEVLQQLLLYLDFWTLLRCQRVCKLWRELIPGDSPLLQEVLYLRPSRELQIYSTTPACFDFDFDVTPLSVESGPQPLGSRFTVGVRKEFAMTRRCIGLIRTSSEIVFHPIIVDFNHHVRRDDFKRSLQEEGGSWKDMLVSMPPLRELRLRYGMKRSVYRVLSVGADEDGIRLGNLFRVMDEWAGGSMPG